MKKLISFGVGIALLASPLIVAAQTVSTSSNTSLIAVLTQLVQVLEQELQQLVAAQANTTNDSSTVDKTAQPNTRQYGVVEFTTNQTSGAAPLQVQFTINNWDDVSNPIVDFGDGTSGPPLNFAIAASQDEDTLAHTYTAPGTYTAKFEDASGNVLSIATITVTGGNSTQPSATIDQSSLTTGFSTPTITGTATGISQVEIDLKGYSSIIAAVSNGTWSAQLPIYSAGSYAIQVSNPNTGTVLTTGTLVISGSTGTKGSNGLSCTLTPSGTDLTGTNSSSYAVNSGGSVVLTWASQNASWTTNNFGGAKEAPSGSMTINDITSSTNNYIVTAYDANGDSATCSTTVGVKG